MTDRDPYLPREVMKEIESSLKELIKNTPEAEKNDLGEDLNTVAFNTIFGSF